MAKLKIRHLVAKTLKSGRTLYYWQPPAALRKQGFQSRRLPDDMAEAIKEAEKCNRDVDDWRRGEERVPFPPETIPWLIRLYVLDERFTDLKPNTQRSYRQCLDRIEQWSVRAGHPPLKSIKRRHVSAFKKSMATTPAMANMVIRVLRVLLGFAVDEEYIDENPAKEPRLKGLPPRKQLWSDKHIEDLVKKAKEEGRPSIGLAVLLAFNLGQREGDVLLLTRSHYDGNAFKITQSKTGTTVNVPATVQLKAALSETPRLSPNIVISEATGRPYKVDHFRHEFRRIADLANVPRDLQFMDLRRTAIVRLGEAGCSTAEISAVSGHSIERTEKILETYLPRTTVMAQNAICKLESHKPRTKLEG